jgi:hypothetical protein
MAEEKIGKKPNVEGGSGIENLSISEVEGHETKWLLYNCFNCVVLNYVDPSWKYFTCWRCGPAGLNYI